MRLLPTSELCWLGALSAACSGEAALDCPDDAASDCADVIDLAIGTGDPEVADYEALPVEGVTPLFSGEQGGYHVFLQLRSRGVCSDRIVFERRIRLPGDDRVVRSQAEVLSLVEHADGWSILPRSQPTFVCPSSTPGVAMDRALELEVTIVEQPGPCDPAGATRSATRHFALSPRCSDGDVVCRDDPLLGCAAPAVPRP